VVLDALASVGLYGDGRLMALSSYENRVYQVTLEDGERVVAKFYRPERWSEAQILEEHAFAAELMAAEVPAVGPLVLAGRTLHSIWWLPVLGQPLARRPPARAGRLRGARMDWPLSGAHPHRGRGTPVCAPPRAGFASFGAEPRDWLLEHELIPLDVQSAGAMPARPLLI
jgi:hypothetical protein